MRILHPPGWPRPKGYSNGIEAMGRMVFVAGMVGWDENEQIVSDDLVEQIRRALENIISVLREAGAVPSDLVRLTWYVTDKGQYLARAKEIGSVYREVLGAHYPAMAMLVVKDLVEAGAKVEIEATAVVPH